MYLCTRRNCLNLGSHLRHDPDREIFWRILQHCDIGYFSTVWFSGKTLIIYSWKFYRRCIFGQGNPPLNFGSHPNPESWSGPDAPWRRTGSTSALCLPFIGVRQGHSWFFVFVWFVFGVSYSAAADCRRCCSTVNHSICRIASPTELSNLCTLNVQYQNSCWLSFVLKDYDSSRVPDEIAYSGTEWLTADRSRSNWSSNLDG